MMVQPVLIAAAVEGPVDEAVVRRLIVHAGGHPGSVHGKNGKDFLRKNIHRYNHAARHAPWVVLVDLDQEASCAPPMRARWLRLPAPRLCFRIAVRAVESWMLADAETIAEFLGVARSRVPADPEALPCPKTEMVNLARRSRRKAIRHDMIPREGSGRAVGPAYTSRLIEYVESHWRPELATGRSDSLRRALDCLKRLVKETA